MNKQLNCGDVKNGDIVKVYFSLMQQMYGGEPDTLQVTNVIGNGYNLESFIMPIKFPIPFTLSDIIAVYRKEDNSNDYKLIWYDEKHKEYI